MSMLPLLGMYLQFPFSFCPCLLLGVLAGVFGAPPAAAVEEPVLGCSFGRFVAASFFLSQRGMVEERTDVFASCWIMDGGGGLLCVGWGVGRGCECV